MSWKTCDNCYEKRACDCMSLFPKECRLYGLKYWKPIPCPFCGGALSEVREHIRPRQQRMYRHCYSCHFEFKEEK